MRALLDILTDEKVLMDEIQAIEQALARPESTSEKEKLENRLIDLQMEYAEVLEEMRDYIKSLFE